MLIQYYGVKVLCCLARRKRWLAGLCLPDGVSGSEFHLVRTEKLGTLDRA